MNIQELRRHWSMLHPEERKAVNELIGILNDRPESGAIVGEYLNTHDSIPHARYMLDTVREVGT